VPQGPVHDKHIGDESTIMELYTIELLERRGVTLRDIAEIVYTIQAPYVSDLTVDECLEAVRAVLAKREVQHTLITGITLDILAEEGRLPEPLQTILRHDDFLYGVDETLALGITNVYGSIGLTNFGYLDKMKIGILQTLNQHMHDPNAERVHAFLDDLVAGVAAAAAARIAHHRSNSVLEAMSEEERRKIVDTARAAQSLAGRAVSPDRTKRRAASE